MTLLGSRVVAVAIAMASVAAVTAAPASAERATSSLRAFQAGLIDTGYAHTCAVLSAGNLRCWGYGGQGQLGYGTTGGVGDGSGPAISTIGDVPVGAPVRSIALGYYHTCALLTTGKVRCWGDNDHGELGYANFTDVGDGLGPSIQTAGNVPIGGDAVAIAAGHFHTCALLTTGKVRCWGDGSSGQLGHDATTGIAGIGRPSIEAAGDVPIGPDAIATAITAGDTHTCALLSTGKVRCWGDGFYGRLGYGNPNDVGDGGISIQAAGDVPIGPDAIATAITAGDQHTCALLTTGKVRCWGNGDDGRLGYGSITRVGNGGGPSIEVAGDVVIGADAIAISAGLYHTCALLTNAKVRCWGYGAQGQLGHDNTTNIGDTGHPIDGPVPGDVPVGVDAVAISTLTQSCALLVTGKVRCWGENDNGQLGYGNKVRVGDGIGKSVQVAGDVETGGLLFGKAADVAVALAADPPTTTAGTSTTVTVTASNGGPDPTGPLAITAPAPAGTSVGQSTPSVGEYDHATGSWTLPALASGASATLALVINTPAAGARNATAEVASANAGDVDSIPGNGVTSEDDYATVTITTNEAPSGGGNPGGGGTTPGGTTPSGTTPSGGGAAGATLRVDSSITLRYQVFRTYTRLIAFTISDVPAGGKVRVLCTGATKRAAKACPFKDKSFTGRSVKLLKTFKKRKLLDGTTLDVRITAPGRIGKRIAYAFRKRKGPMITRGCLDVSSAKPTRC